MNSKLVTSFLCLFAAVVFAIELRYEPFDGSIPADFGARKAHFCDGLKGRAIIFEDIGPGQRVPCLGCNLEASKGAVSLWINLQDYNGSDEGSAIFFSADSPEAGRIIIYKPQAGRLLFFYNLGKDVARVFHDIRNWTSGNWHHIAATWDAGLMNLYVDGNLVGSGERSQIGHGKMDNMAVGTLKFIDERGHTAIDELRLYSEPLSAAQVSRIYYEDSGKSMLDVPSPLAFSVGKANSPVHLDAYFDENEYAAIFPGGFGESGAIADQSVKWGFSSQENNLAGAIQAPEHYKIFTISLFEADNKLRSWRYELGKDEQHDGLQVVGAKDKQQITWEFKVSLLDRKFRLDLELAAEDRETIRLSPLRSSGDIVNFAMIATSEDCPVWHIQDIGVLNEGKVNFSSLVPAGSSLRVKCQNTISRRRTDTTTAAEGKTLKHQRAYGEDGDFTFILTAPDKSNLWTMRGIAEISSPVTTKSIGADQEKRELVFEFRKRAPDTMGKLHFTLTDQKTGELAASQDFIVPAGKGQWKETVALGDLSGLFELEVTHINHRGRKGKTYRQLCGIPQKGQPAAWLDNNYGKTPGQVPPPWKPILSKGRTLKTLAQEYAWSDGFLPEMKVAGEKHLFYGTPQMLLDDQVVTGKWHTVFAASDLVKMEFLGTTNGIAVAAEASVEFDGFIWYRIMLRGEEASIVNKLQLIFPLAPEFSVLAVNNRRGEHLPPEQGGNGPIPASGWFGELYKLPAIWVGGNAGGLSFTAETLEHWSLSDKKDTFRVKPNAHGAEAVVTIVNRPLQVGEPGRKYAFGLQGTPTKPMPKTFPLISIEMDWPITEGGQRYFNGMYQEAWNFSAEGRHKEVLRKMRQKSTTRKQVFYSSVAGASPYCPDWSWWGASFVLTEHGELGLYTNEYMTADDAARDLLIWTCCCANSPAYRSYRLNGYKTILDNREEWLINDLYCDQVGPLFCKNETHGCGWRDEDGVFYPTYNLLGSREMMKRIYIMLKQALPDAELLYHSTGQASVTPVTSFATGFADGEDTYNGEVARRETYFGLFTPEDYRSSFCGEKWGFSICVIPQFARSAYFSRPDRCAFWRKNPPEPAARKAYRHYFGYSIVHNVPIWVCEVYLPELILDFRKQITQVIGAWDEKVDFLPYWEAEKHGMGISSQQPDRILLSAYRRGEDKALLVLFNDTDEAQNVFIIPDFAKLLGKPNGVLKELSGVPLSVNGQNAYPITIAPQEYLLFQAQGK